MKKDMLKKPLVITIRSYRFNLGKRPILKKTLESVGDKEEMTILNCDIEQRSSGFLFNQKKGIYLNYEQKDVVSVVVVLVKHIK